MFSTPTRAEQMQNQEAVPFDEQEAYRARTNHGARDLNQLQARHRRNISHQAFQGAQVQRMRSLKHLQNNYIELQNQMSGSDNVDQLARSSKHPAEVQHPQPRQLQSPSLINVGANLMNDPNEYAGRREAAEGQANEMMSQTQYSSEYWQQLGSGTNKELRKINVSGSQTMSKFIKDRVLLGSLRKSQAQPSQRQNGLKDSYQRLGNQFMPPLGNSQAQHGYTPRNLGRLLKQRATMARGSQSQGRAIPDKQLLGVQSNPRPTIAPISTDRQSTARQHLHRQSAASFASATRQALRPVGADPAAPIDKASIDDKYTALQRGYDDIFKSQQQ